MWFQYLATHARRHTQDLNAKNHKELPRKGFKDLLARHTSLPMDQTPSYG